MAKFRFQDLEICQDAIEIAGKLFDITDLLYSLRSATCAGQVIVKCG